MLSFDDIEAYLGQSVAKHFDGHGLFEGKVTSWRCVGGRLWFRVRFGDGDEEEFSKTQLLRVLKGQKTAHSPLGVPSTGCFDTLVGTRVRKRFAHNGEFVGAVVAREGGGGGIADSDGGSWDVRWSDGSTTSMTPCAVRQHAFRGSLDGLMEAATAKRARTASRVRSTERNASAPK